MKTIIATMVAVFLWQSLFHRSNKLTPKQWRQKLDQQNEEAARKLVERGFMTLAMPGQAIGYDGMQVFFDINPAGINDFLKWPTGEWVRFLSDPRYEEDINSRFRRQWKGYPRVYFQYDMGDRPEGWIPVCDGKVWMKFWEGLNNPPHSDIIVRF